MSGHPHLVPVDAPYFRNAYVVIVTDCVPFAYSDFHNDFLEGMAIAIGGPKLDDLDAYANKVTSILEKSDIRSLKVIHMEVPCCYGLVHIAQESFRRSKKDTRLDVVKIGI